MKSLLYIVTKSRPDLAVAASILGSYVSKPTEKHLTQAKRELQYLKAMKHNKFTMKSGVSDQL